MVLSISFAIVISGSGSTCLNVSSTEFQYQQCQDAQPYCVLDPLLYNNGASCSANHQVAQAKTNLPNGSTCSSSSECLSQNCASSICTQGTIANGQACNHPQQCSSTTCFNGSCKEPVKLGQVCQAGQCSSSQKCLQLHQSYVTSGTCQARITSGSCLYHNQCADGYYCNSSNVCTSYPTTSPASCQNQYECPSNKYCDHSSNTCLARIQIGNCDISNSSCVKSRYCSFSGECKQTIAFDSCTYNIQCLSGYCDSYCFDMTATGNCGIDEGDFCSGSNYCHPSAPQNVKTYKTCQFPIPGSCTTDDDCSSSQYCDSSSGCTNLKDPDTACTDDKECKGLCLTGSCKAIGSLSLGEEAGGKYKLCKSGYIPASQTTCGSLTRSSSQSFFCDTANKCDYTDNNGNTVQLDCRCGGNGATPSFKGHCPNYRGTQDFQSLIELADDLGVLKQEHFDDPFKLGVHLIGIDKTVQKNLFAVVRFYQVIYPNLYATDELFAIKNEFQNAPSVKGITKALDLLYTKQFQDWASSLLLPDLNDLDRVFLSTYMSDDELNTHIDVFNILLKKQNVSIADSTSYIKSFANQYINLQRYNCDNTFKIYQIVTDLYRSQIKNGINVTQVQAIFQNLKSKGNGCPQNSQMQNLSASITADKIDKLRENVLITSSLSEVTQLFLTIPQSLRPNYVQSINKFYSAFIYKAEQEFQVTRHLQAQGQLNPGSKECTLNQFVGFIHGKFSDLKDDLVNLNSGNDLTIELSKVQKLAGFAIDFSPYSKHTLSLEIKAQVKSNPGNSYPVLIIELSQSKCNEQGSLPQNGCGVKYQKSTQWGAQISPPVVFNPVGSPFNNNVAAEYQVNLSHVSKYKPFCGTILYNNNTWNKIATIPIRRSYQIFTFSTTQAGIFSLLYYIKSGQDCVDLRQALDLKSYQQSSDLIGQLYRMLFRPPNQPEFYTSTNYQCSNCYDQSQTSRKAAQILIDQRTSQYTLRRQLAISFYYSLFCWCRSPGITQAQRAQIASNICFFLRQYCRSFWRQYRWLEIDEQDQLRNLQAMRILLENQNKMIYNSMENSDDEFSKQQVQVIRQVFYGVLLSLIGGNVPPEYLKDVPKDHLRFHNGNFTSFFLIKNENFYDQNRLQLFDQKTNNGTTYKIQRLMMIEPLERLADLNNDDSSEKIILQYSLSAYSRNNMQLVNGILQVPVLVGTHKYQIQRDQEYKCFIFKQDKNGNMTYHKQNIKTKFDRQNGVIACLTHQLGTIAIASYKIKIVEELVQYGVYLSIVILFSLKFAVWMVCHQLQQKKTRAILQEHQGDETGKSITFYSRVYRPHFSIKKNSCCQLFFTTFYYSNPLFRWILYFDSIKYGTLLFLVKAAQALLRVSLISLSIFTINGQYLYWAIVILATFSFSPLQAIFFRRSYKFDCSELMHIISTGENKAHRVNKMCAIIGIVAALVASIVAFTFSALSISGSIIKQNDFILRLLIPFALIFGFAFVQAIVLNLIYGKCKRALTPKNCFVKDLYEVLVARDVRLIFKDQEALKGDVCKHGKVAPVDSSVIIGIESEPQVNEGQSEVLNQNEQHLQVNEGEPQGLNQNEQQPQVSKEQFDCLNQNESQPQESKEQSDGLNQNESQPQESKEQSDGLNQNQSQPQVNKEQSDGLNQNESELEESKEQSDGLNQNQSQPQVNKEQSDGLNQNESELEESKEQSDGLNQNESKLEENDDQFDDLNNTAILTGRSDAPFVVPVKGHARTKTAHN